MEKDKVNSQRYKPTDAIVNNSLKGLALLEKNNSLKAKAKKQELEAISKQLQDTLSSHEVQSLYFNLLKAKDRYNPKQLLAGYNVTPDTASFLALGGNAALAWCSAIVNKSAEDKAKVEAEDNIPGIPLQVVKSVNTEKRLATFVVLEPQDDDYTTTDAHLDWYDEDTVEKACHSFNRSMKRANILHMVHTNGFEFIESYITKADMSIDGRFVRKGSWLATIYVSDEPEYEWIWEGIKDGTFNGLSIQCLGQVESIEE
jgi:hypothetical protein